MKVAIEVSLDAYYPSLSPELQQAITREVNKLLNEEKRITVKTVATNGAAKPEKKLRMWTEDGDGSPLNSPYRVFAVGTKIPSRGATARIIIALQKKYGQETTIPYPELLHMLRTHAPDRAPQEFLSTLWVHGYIESLGLEVPKDSALAESAVQPGVAA